MIMNKCKNDSWINPKAEIRNSKIQGKGLFTKSQFRKGEIVVIWNEKYINKDDAEKAKKKGKLVIQWDVNLYSCENRGDDKGYFINHSCNPNLWMKNINSLETRKNIKKGDEITIDYALFVNEDYFSSWTCCCGNRNCRKKITGKDWKIKRLQKEYKNHFSPLINNRIKNLKKRF